MGAIAMMETIRWRPIDAPPDADKTVLLLLSVDENPSWPGFWDGEQWRNPDGIPFRPGHVRAWAEMPTGQPVLGAEFGYAYPHDHDPLGR